MLQLSSQSHSMKHQAEIMKAAESTTPSTRRHSARMLQLFCKTLTPTRNRKALAALQALVTVQRQLMVSADRAARRYAAAVQIQATKSAAAMTNPSDVVLMAHLHFVEDADHQACVASSMRVTHCLAAAQCCSRLLLHTRLACLISCIAFLPNTEHATSTTAQYEMILACMRRPVPRMQSSTAHSKACACCLSNTAGSAVSFPCILNRDAAMACAGASFSLLSAAGWGWLGNTVLGDVNGLVFDDEDAICAVGPGDGRLLLISLDSSCMEP